MRYLGSCKVKNKTKFKTNSKIWEYFGQLYPLYLKENDITKVVEPERIFAHSAWKKLK
jgi:hypothetical protein